MMTIHVPSKILPWYIGDCLGSFYEKASMLLLEQHYFLEVVSLRFRSCQFYFFQRQIACHKYSCETLVLLFHTRVYEYAGSIACLIISHTRPYLLAISVWCFLNKVMMVQISAWLSLFTKKCIFGCYWMMLQQSPNVLSTELFLHVSNALCYDYFPSCLEVLANWSRNH